MLKLNLQVYFQTFAQGYVQIYAQPSAQSYANLVVVI